MSWSEYGTTFGSVTVEQWSAAGATAGNYTNGSKILQIDFSGAFDNTAATAFTKDTVVNRCEHGAFIFGKHQSLDFKLRPTLLNPSCAVANTITNTGGGTAGNYNNIPSTTPWYGNVDSGSGVVWYDNDWQTEAISVVGAPVGSTFRFETAICMEVVPQISSVFRPLVNKTSPDSKSDVLAANTKVNSMPVAVSTFQAPN